MNHSRSQQVEWCNRRPHPAGCSISPGFSLVELLIVLLIIGFAAAVAAPRYANAMQNYRIDAATRQITHLMTLAQRQARGTGKSITVTFNASTDSIQLTDSSGGVLSDLQLDEPPFDADITGITLSNGSVLVFNGYGQTATDVSISVTVANASRTVTYDDGMVTSSIPTP